jgi:hypothetical protein
VHGGGTCQLHHVLDHRLYALQFSRHNPVEFLPDVGVVVVQRHQLREDQDRRQRVADVVGNAGRHRAQRSQAVRAPQALL